MAHITKYFIWPKSNKKFIIDYQIELNWRQNWALTQTLILTSSLSDGFENHWSKNKARQIILIVNIFYPLICIRMYAYQGVRNVCFSKNLVYFVFLFPLVLDSPYCLVTDNISCPFHLGHVTCFAKRMVCEPFVVISRILRIRIYYIKPRSCSE